MGKETNGNVLLRLISRESCQTYTIYINKKFRKRKIKTFDRISIFFLWLRGGGGIEYTHRFIRTYQSASTWPSNQINHYVQNTTHRKKRNKIIADRISK